MSTGNIPGVPGEFPEIISPPIEDLRLFQQCSEDAGGPNEMAGLLAAPTAVWADNLRCTLWGLDYLSKELREAADRGPEAYERALQFIGLFGIRLAEGEGAFDLDLDTYRANEERTNTLATLSKSLDTGYLHFRATNRHLVGGRALGPVDPELIEPMSRVTGPDDLAVREYELTAQQYKPEIKAASAAEYLREIGRKIYANPNCELTQDEVRFLYLDIPFIGARWNDQPEPASLVAEFESNNAYRRIRDVPELTSEHLRKACENYDIDPVNIRDMRGVNARDYALVEAMLPEVLREQAEYALESYNIIASSYNAHLMAAKPEKKVRHEPIPPLARDDYLALFEKNTERWRGQGVYDYLTDQAVNHGVGYMLVARPQDDYNSTSMHRALETIAKDQLKIEIPGSYETYRIRESFECDESMRYHRERKASPTYEDAVSFSLILSREGVRPEQPADLNLRIPGLTETMAYWLRLHQQGHRFGRFRNNAQLTDILFNSDVKPEELLDRTVTYRLQAGSHLFIKPRRYYADDHKQRVRIAIGA